MTNKEQAQAALDDFNANIEPHLKKMMKTFDLTKPQHEPNVFDFTQPDPLLAIDEKINYIADLLEVALKMEYLR